MEQRILTPAQQKVLELLANHPILAPQFYLSGGTALAEYYLKHRYSDDLDFFTDAKDFPQLEIEQFARNVQIALGATSLEYRRLYDRRIFFFALGQEELKMEFTFYPFLHLENPTIYNSVAIDSLSDITAGKFMALMDRTEPKDFVDFYFLMRYKDITTLRIQELVEKKFGMHIDPVTVGSEFAKVRNISRLPRMIQPLTIEELKAFFSDRMRELKNVILE